MSRAEKRHHRERLKKKRRHNWRSDMIDDPVRVAKFVNTPTPCSCWMCGNARTHWGEVTIQERRADQTFKEEV